MTANETWKGIAVDIVTVAYVLRFHFHLLCYRHNFLLLLLFRNYRLYFGSLLLEYRRHIFERFTVLLLSFYEVRTEMHQPTLLAQPQQLAPQHSVWSTGTGGGYADAVLQLLAEVEILVEDGLREGLLWCSLVIVIVRIGIIHDLEVSLTSDELLIAETIMHEIHSAVEDAFS